MTGGARRRSVQMVLLSVLALLASGSASAESDVVRLERKIAAGASGFTGTLDPFDFFGDAVAAIGDVDGDGVGDLAVGATGDDDCGDDNVSSCGAVWIVFLRSDGTVKGQQKISGTQGGFTGRLVIGDWFGAAVTGLDDVDGDGVVDLAVGATCPNNGGCGGAVWILRLNPNGTVKAHTKIGAGLGGFTGTLAPRSEFGRALALVDDLDGDGLRDLAVGAPGSSGTGRLWILFLAADATVRAQVAIDGTTAALAGALDPVDRFGISVAVLGDLDGDGTPDLAIGAEGDDDGGTNRGAVWMLFLEPGGVVGAVRKISATAGNFTDPIPDQVQFGRAVAAIGDLDGDGVVDLVVGAPGIDDGGLNRGGAWLVFLDASGAAVGQQKISDTAGGFDGDLNAFQVEFGSAAAALGDLDGDGREDVAIGARGFGNSATHVDAGAVWELFLDVGATPTPTPTATPVETATPTATATPVESVTPTSSATPSRARPPWKAQRQRRP